MDKQSYWLLGWFSVKLNNNLYIKLWTDHRNIAGSIYLNMLTILFGKEKERKKEFVMGNNLLNILFSIWYQNIHLIICGHSLRLRKKKENLKQQFKKQRNNMQK